MNLTTEEYELIFDSLNHYINISDKWDEIEELLIKVEEELHGTITITESDELP